METVDKRICLEILDRGLKNSWYYYSSGREAHAYYNIDIAMLGETSPSDQLRAIEKLADQFARAIAEIDKEEPFDRLAFIDKAGHGPVGMIALSSLLILKTHKEAIFVRPYRNSRRSITEGRPLRSDERVLIVSDVATTGGTVLKAAAKLWDVGALVRGVLVFFDQELGASETLQRKDIRLYRILTRNEARQEPEMAERLHDTHAKTIREFGGVM